MRTNIGAKVTLWALAMSGAGLVLLGTSSATQPFHPSPGQDEMAMGTFECSEPAGQAQGFSFLSFRGTSGIASPFLQGQFSTAAGPETPVTCSGLAQQLAADSVAGGCTAGPVANVASDGGGATTVHFVCSGGHDAVVAAIAVISRDLAAVTLSGALD